MVQYGYEELLAELTKRNAPKLTDSTRPSAATQRKTEIFTGDFCPDLKEAMLPFTEQAYIRKAKITGNSAKTSPITCCKKDAQIKKI